MILQQRVPRKRSERIHTLAGALLVAGTFLVAGAFLVGIPALAGPATFDKDGNLLRPEGYREWVFVGAQITPKEMNEEDRASLGFQVVYLDPESFVHYRNTGSFRDGAAFAFEFVAVGDHEATSGKGYFMGEIVGLEASVKDAKRFPDEPGNWGFFSFVGEKKNGTYGRKAKSAALPAEECGSCHEMAAAEDLVFTQYYPVLRAIKPN